MEVQIISKEDIKPSSPTPQHLRTFKFSLLDQFIPAPYAPVVLFYPNLVANHDHLDLGDPVPKRLSLLKTSLSETLSRFYPLAGKMNEDGLSIECNDVGAYYVEARVNCRLDEFLTEPDLLSLHGFLPRDVIAKESDVVTHVANIQVNVFECGGLAMGICISHKMLDGAALSTFLKAWSATASGSCCEQIAHPDFSGASIFPANDRLWLRDTSMVMWGSLFKEGICVTKRFVFDASAIASLKALASSGTKSCCRTPTRVEAVSAFIWKCVMAASKEKHGYQRPCLATHLVNLRRRTTPPAPLSDNSTGNLLWIAAAKCLTGDKPALHELVGELRDAISKLDGEFVKKLMDGAGVMRESLKHIAKLCSQVEVDHVGFSSWCNFGFYEVDFGWCKPIWVSSYGLSGLLVMNLVIFVDTRSGDGIEAWMTLDEQNMAILVSTNSEFLHFASVDPSPLMT